MMGRWSLKFFFRTPSEAAMHNESLVQSKKISFFLFFLVTSSLFATTLFTSCGPITPSVNKAAPTGAASLSASSSTGSHFNDEEHLRTRSSLLQEEQDSVLQVQMVSQNALPQALQDGELNAAINAQYRHVSASEPRFQSSGTAEDGALVATYSINSDRISLLTGNRYSYLLILSAIPAAEAAVQAAEFSGSLHSDLESDGQRILLRISARGISSQAWTHLLSQIQSAHVFALDHFSGK